MPDRPGPGRGFPGGGPGGWPRPAHDRDGTPPSRVGHPARAARPRDDQPGHRRHRRRRHPARARPADGPTPGRGASTSGCGRRGRRRPAGPYGSYGRMAGSLPTRGDPMQVQVRHQPSFAVARCLLAPGEPLRVESGAMLATSWGVQLEASVQGGLLKGLKRAALGGESLFVTTYTAPQGGVGRRRGQPARRHRGGDGDAGPAVLHHAAAAGSPTPTGSTSRRSGAARRTCSAARAASSSRPPAPARSCWARTARWTRWSWPTRARP